jgi:hypothetical protein
MTSRPANLKRWRPVSQSEADWPTVISANEHQDPPTNFTLGIARMFLKWKANCEQLKAGSCQLI